MTCKACKQPILTDEEWGRLADAFDNCMSNIRTFDSPEDCGIDAKDWETMLRLERKLGGKDVDE